MQDIKHSALLVNQLGRGGPGGGHKQRFMDWFGFYHMKVGWTLGIRKTTGLTTLVMGNGQQMSISACNFQGSGANPLWRAKPSGPPGAGQRAITSDWPRLRNSPFCWVSHRRQVGTEKPRHGQRAQTPSFFLAFKLGRLFSIDHLGLGEPCVRRLQRIMSTFSSYQIASPQTGILKTGYSWRLILSGWLCLTSCPLD